MNEGSSTWVHMEKVFGKMRLMLHCRGEYTKRDDYNLMKPIMAGFISRIIRK